MKLKTILPFLLMLLNYTHLFSQTASITSASMSNNSIQITYSITGATESQRFDVELWYSINGAALKKCFSISNNEGTLLKLKAGIGKQLTWNVLTDLPRLEANILDFELRVGATNANYTETSTGSASGAGIEMVFIEGGTFTMGSPTSEVDRSDNETQHQVALSSFYMSKTEVTQAQWRVVMGNNPSSFEGDNLPVEHVSWDDVQTFIEKLNQQTGKQYRLPTEAEWEYACRASTTTPFNTGNNLTTSQANYDGNYPYNNNAKGEYRQKTMPVGSFAPNAWGLFDMHGNVWEWCNDWYGDYSTTAQAKPKGASSGSCRVIRGGCWSDDAQDCRAANRSFNTPDLRRNYMGFRLVSPK